MNDGDLRDPGSGEAGHVAEDPSTINEDLGLVQQVCAPALHQADRREPLLERDLLGPQALLESHRGDAAALDGGVVGSDHAADPTDKPDADDVSAPGDVLLAVVVVHAESGEGGELDKHTAGVEQTGHALPRQELAALLELRAGLVGVGTNAGLGIANGLNQRQHLCSVGGKGLAGGFNRGLEDRHD